MPVLRAPADNSIGETLGSLGAALSNAWNPRNRWEAYLLQQRMLMEQLQRQQLQQQLEARQRAIAAYGALPPDKLATVTNMILNNASQSDIDNFLQGKVATDIAKTKADTAKTTLETQTSQRQFDAGEALKASQTLPPGLKAIFDYQVAAGKSATEAMQAVGLAMPAIDADTPEAMRNNIQRETWITGKPPTSYPVVGPVTQTAAQTASGIAKFKEAEGTAAGTQAGGGVAVPAGEQRLYPPGQTIGGGGGSGPWSLSPLNPAPPSVSQPPVSQPPVSQTPAAPTPAAPAPTASRGASPALVVAGMPGFTYNGAQVRPPTTSQGADGSTIYGASPTDIEVAKNMTADNLKELNDAVTGGEAAAKLKTVVSQIRALSRIVQPNGAFGQIDAATANFLKEHGLIVTNAQQAQAAMDNLIQNEVPSIAKDEHVQRYAKPEIDQISRVTGSANLPTPTMMNILANLSAKADLMSSERDNALKVLGQDPSNTMTMPDYRKTQTQLLNGLGAATETYRQQYGAIGTTPPAPPSGENSPSQTLPPPPASSPGVLGEVGSWLGSLFGGGSTPNSTTPPPPPAAPPDNSSHVIMKNGVWVPVQ